MDVNEIISSGILELYVAGLTSEEENAQVLQWKKQYPAVADALNAIEESIEAYAQAQSITPSSSVKEKIFSSIHSEEQNVQSIELTESIHKVRSIKPYWQWVAAASVILFIASGTLNIMFYQQYNSLNNNLQQTQQELADARSNMDVMKNDMNVVQSKYSEPVMLKGMNETPDAVAKIFWVKNTGDVFVDPSNLPAIPSGKQFQLWAIVDGKPVDAGMIITTDKNKRYHIQKMKSFGKAQAFAITIEKEGGSPTPTMEKMVVMGKL